ncbi:MAG: hypothetical protein LBP40_02260, partial [Campylobacteraceae bacterium]|nr:hypothetical protein [Campylobacteraceae bacterium]
MHLYDLNQSVLINITRNINKFLLISLFSVFYFGSNLYAVCTDLGSGVISCDDTVNASVYELYAENSSYDINTITNNARGVYNDNNGSWILNSLNITSSGTDSHALSALNANITVGNNININTTNDRSKGILSEENSTVNVGSNINIYTDGQDSIGIHAAGTGSDYAVQYSRAAVNVGDNVTIRTKGSDIYPTQSRSDGISAKYGDITIGNNVDVLTTGIGSYGIRADYASTMVIGDNLSVVTTGQHGQQSTQYSGWWSYGIVSIKGSDIVIGDNLVVDVKGNNTLAVEAQTYWATRGFGVSKITIGDNARISTAGNETSVGLWASSGGQINIGDNAYIITTGGMGKGPTSAVQASDRYESMVNGEWLRPIINMGNNATIITTGIYSHGVYSYYGNITIGDNAKIITTNSSSNGVYSWGSASTNNIASSYGGSNVAIGDNSSVSVASSAIALYARQNGNITMGDNAVVNVNGSGSTAIGVHNYSTGVPVKLNLASNITFTGKATVNVDGSGSKVFSIGYDNGSVYFNDEAAINTFNESNDIFAVNTANKYNSNIHFNDALTINAYGNNSKAIYLDNGYTYDFNELDVNVYGANSYALYVGAD